MKIINYKYGYLFGCSIHGKIVVSAEEWKTILKYLRSAKVKKSFIPSYPWTNTMLEKDIKRTIPAKGGQLVNIRVPMTEKAVRKFADLRETKKYRVANYMFLIMDQPHE